MTLFYDICFQDKMDEMMRHNMSWIEVQFLSKAVDILSECRRTLMFTYAFAYYLQKNNESEIFEVNWISLVSQLSSAGVLSNFSS